MNKIYIERAEAEKGREKELVDLLISQEQSVWERCRAGCADCATDLHVANLFRCLYCGFWYCADCAGKHFGTSCEGWDDAPDPPLDRLKGSLMSLANYNPLFRTGEGELEWQTGDQVVDGMADDVDAAREAVCEMAGHDWVLDQCGWWQHQYCEFCEAAKYPDLSKKRCSELQEEMGDMTEEEYLSILRAAGQAAE